MESEQEAERRLAKEWIEKNRLTREPNPPLPPKKVVEKTTRPRNKSLVKKQTGKEPSALPQVRKVPSTKPKAKSHPGRGVFRFAAKNGFLTFPQYKGNLEPADVMVRVKSFFASKELQLESAICALENHSNDSKEDVTEDPGVHYHIIFKCKKRIDTSDPRYFDELLEQHGDYKPCRQFLSSVIYATKENNYSLFNLDINSIRKAIESKTSVAHHTVANKILEKPFRTMEKITNKWPGYVLQHKNKVEDFVEMVQGFQLDRKLPYYGVEIPWPDLMNPAPQAISAWVSKNFDGSKRPHKQKQLYVWGETNMGKSSLLMDLEQRFNRYIICDEEKFDSDYNDATVQFCTLDEFVGQKKVSWINSFVEGAPMRLNKKGTRNGYTKRGNPPVIFCSNKPLEEVYSELKVKCPTQFEALKERFLEVHVTKQFRLVFLEAPVEVLREEQGLNPDPRQGEVEEDDNAMDTFAEDLATLDQINNEAELFEQSEEEEGSPLPPPDRPLKRTQRIYIDPKDDESSEEVEIVKTSGKKLFKKTPAKKRRKFLPDSEEESEDLK